MNRVLQVGTTDSIDVGIQKYNSFTLTEMPSGKVSHCILYVRTTAQLNKNRSSKGMVSLPLSSVVFVF